MGVQRMSFLSDLEMYAQFAWRLRGFLIHTITLEEARAIVVKRLARREKNFLAIVKRGIYGYSKSPYLPLLKFAGCEMGDIENMVRDKGLEGTLKTLKEAGVYVTFEEFKGREPIVRNGKVIPAEAKSFNNPYLSYVYHTESSGTTGERSRVPIDLDHWAAHASLIMLTYDAHRVLGVPTANWHSILPDSSALGNILQDSRFGQVTEKWFSTIASRDFKPALKNRLATLYIVVLGRLVGVPLPWPEPVRLDEAAVVARWAAGALRVRKGCLIRTSVSRALRVCIAAQEEGLDLTGATFLGGGEPPTPAKVHGITATGARWAPSYYFIEAGLVGMGCARPADGNDIHFFKDILALIQYPRQVTGWNVAVDAFYFTSLLPTAPRILLNVESDDYGVIENRPCGCPLETYGFTEHLRDIRSFRKLTGEGVTLVGSEIVKILEETLPARFGGSPLDYQLLEDEDENGFTRLSLLVSPKIEIADEGAIIKVFLEAMGRSSVAADLARAIWSQAKTLQVKRREPIWTARGKLMPLHLAKKLGG